MTSFIIDRSRWGCGATLHGDYALLRDPRTGLLDALGFYLRSLDFPDVQLNNKSTVSDGLRSELRFMPELDWLFQRAPLMPSPEERLTDANDDVSLTDEAREQTIRGIFDVYGDARVTYVGRYADAELQIELSHQEAA